MAAAEAQMLQLPSNDILWVARRDAIAAYPTGPARNQYLDYFAQRMLAEKYSRFELRWRDFLTFFSLNGRCDLIQEVTQHGAESCVEPQKIADAINRPPSNIADMQKMAAHFGEPARVMESIPLNEKAIDVALAGPGLWWRVTRLLTLVNRCKAELTGNQPLKL